MHNAVCTYRVGGYFGISNRTNLRKTAYLVYETTEHIFNSKNAEMVSYADDTTVFVTGVSETEVEGKVNDTLVELKNWADANRTRINSNKKSGPIPTEGERTETHNVCLGNEITEIVDNVKTLGVIFYKKPT